MFLTYIHLIKVKQEKYYIYIIYITFWYEFYNIVYYYLQLYEIMNSLYMWKVSLKRIYSILVYKYIMYIYEL